MSGWTRVDVGQEMAARRMRRIERTDNYMAFHALGLAEPITRALAEERYEAPTPIQAAAIPPALSGRDLVGIAQTGTGKTAAFALPILHRLAAAPKQAQPKGCRVLVLSPTRELSGQIVDSFQTYGRHLRVSVTLAIGGVPIGKQIRALARGVDVLVATPGRLLDLHKSHAVRFDGVEVLVLDEADRMLDMGFIHDIRKVVALLPKARQTLFFSATMDTGTGKLAAQMLTDPVTVAVTPAATTVELIDQRAMRVEKGDKLHVLGQLLRREPVSRALVFTRTKHGADRVVRGLAKAGIAAQAIHGNKTQGQRERVMAAFRSGSVTTLVATDIAARGIDVDGVSHVINYDLPNVPESYVHRIGRTARAGASGVAISLVSGEEVPLMRDIEKLIRRQIAGSGTERHSPPGGGAGKPAGGRPGRQHRRSEKRGGKNRPKYGTARPAHPNGIAGVSFLEPARRGNAAGSPARSG
jgi:superfamily II DNA/RNA helicase